MTQYRGTRTASRAGRGVPYRALSQQVVQIMLPRIKPGMVTAKKRGRVVFFSRKGRSSPGSSPSSRTPPPSLRRSSRCPGCPSGRSWTPARAAT